MLWAQFITAPHYNSCSLLLTHFSCSSIDSLHWLQSFSINLHFCGVHNRLQHRYLLLCGSLHWLQSKTFSTIVSSRGLRRISAPVPPLPSSQTQVFTVLFQLFLFANYTWEVFFQARSYMLPSKCTSLFLWITHVLLCQQRKRREARRHKPTKTSGRVEGALHCHSPSDFQPELLYAMSICCSLVSRKVRKFI